MDQQSSKSPVMTQLVVLDEVLTPPVEQSAAYDQLCEWFDSELAILCERFAAFQTPRSMKSQR